MGLIDALVYISLSHYGMGEFRTNFRTNIPSKAVSEPCTLLLVVKAMDPISKKIHACILTLFGEVMSPNQ